jgi:hypothetical protein
MVVPTYLASVDAFSLARDFLEKKSENVPFSATFPSHLIDLPPLLPGLSTLQFPYVSLLYRFPFILPKDRMTWFDHFFNDTH